jgi:hypothetical protein
MSLFLQLHHCVSLFSSLLSSFSPYASILNVLITTVPSSDDSNSVYLIFAKAMIATYAIDLAAYVLYLISHRQYYYSYFNFTPFPMPMTRTHKEYLLAILDETKWTPSPNNGDGINSILQHFHQHRLDHQPSTINIGF